MPVIQPLRDDLQKYLTAHGLNKKWQKARQLFTENPWHPSLHTEILEPKHNLIYSLRLDKKYRALFLVLKDGTIEIIKITNHYR